MYIFLQSQKKLLIPACLIKPLIYLWELLWLSEAYFLSLISIYSRKRELVTHLNLFWAHTHFHPPTLEISLENFIIIAIDISFCLQLKAGQLSVYKNVNDFMFQCSYRQAWNCSHREILIGKEREPLCDVAKLQQDFMVAKKSS